MNSPWIHRQSVAVMDRSLPWLRSVTAAVTIAIALVLASSGPRFGAQPTVGAQEAAFWRPAAVWSGPSTPLEPGRYAAASDLATAPDGSLWLLDAAGNGLQQRSATGMWTRLLPLPSGLIGRRLVAGGDGLWLLGQRGSAWRLLHLAPAGGAPLELAVGGGSQAAVDLSARPGGGVALALASPAAVELRRGDGSLETRLDLATLFEPGCARGRPTALTADGADGLWLGLARDMAACPGGPQPDPGDPRPPVIDGAVRLDLGKAPRIDRVEPGEVPVDLAMRGDEAWSLTAAGIQPLNGSPLGLLPDATTWSAAALAWLPDGRAVVVTRGCPEGAVLALAEGLEPLMLGTLSRPRGRAPLLPLRLTAWGGRVQSLEGAPPGGEAWPDAQAAALWVDWDPAGRPASGRPVCGSGGGPWAGYLADLAESDGSVWRLWPGGLERLVGPDPAGPSPTGPHPSGSPVDAGGAWWGALAADSGRMSVLDLAGGRVQAFGDDGAGLGAWTVEGLPVDIGLRGRFAYLTDPVRRRVSVHDLLTGRRLAAFGSHLPLLRLQAMADGGVLGLAAGDWALSYSADGRLRAAWPLDKAPNTVHTDLMAGADGWVTDARLRLAPATDGDWAAAPVAEAALDRYAPAPDAPPLPPITAGEACVVRADKRLAEPRVALGEALTVHIQLDGLCPVRPLPGRLLFLLDAPGESEAPTTPGASGRPLAAQGALASLLARLDDQRLALGLLVFQDGQILELPPGSDAGAIRRLGLRTDLGAADLAKGIARATDRLGAPGDDARLVLLLTHPPATGGEAAAQSAALAAARQKGIAVTALLYPPADLGSVAHRAWAAVFAPGEAQLEPAPYQLPLLLPRLAPTEPAAPAFGAVTLIDRLPLGLTPDPGSVFPPDGRWDPADSSLTWQRDPAAADRLGFGYRLRPKTPGFLDVGRPGAVADYRDGFGYAARLTLPLPRAELIAPHPVYLPLLSRGACLGRRRPLNLVLVLDLSSSMAEATTSGVSKLEAARDAAITVLDLLDWRLDQVAIVGFSGRADLVLPLSGDRTAVETALAGLRTAEGTRIDLGLREAQRALASGDRPLARPVVILLTDGRQQLGLEAEAIDASRAIKAGGGTVYTIGLGADADADLLRAIASDPARTLTSPDASALAGLFAAILRVELCGT